MGSVLEWVLADLPEALVEMRVKKGSENDHKMGHFGGPIMGLGRGLEGVQNDPFWGPFLDRFWRRLYVHMA